MLVWTAAAVRRLRSLPEPSYGASDGDTSHGAYTRATVRPVLERVGIRELRNSVAAVVRRAAAGERLVVTVDGQPVAQLGPLEPDRAGLTVWDLAAAGLVEPPRRPDRPEAPPPLPVPADVRVDRLLEQVRGS